MAIGTTAAILGSAVIGAGASAISSGNNRRAINQATAAQTQATNQNNALTRDIYNQNFGILSPYTQRGNAAGETINALLGLSNNAGTAQITGVPGAMPTDPRQGGNALSPQSGFDTFRNSTGYQFRVNEGMNSLGANWLARGLGKSGAAAKSAMTFGQNIASDEFGNYLGQLANQQGVGLSAGSALAGVGTNYANTISANNNNQASMLGNAAIARANNNNALIGNLANIGGAGLGYVSSYRPPASTPAFSF